MKFRDEVTNRHVAGFRTAVAGKLQVGAICHDVVLLAEGFQGGGFAGSFHVESWSIVLVSDAVESNLHTLLNDRLII